MNPIGYNGPPSLGRARAPSLLNPPNHGSGSMEEAKLSSEATYSGSVSPTVSPSVPIRRDQSDFENFSEEDVRDDEETGLTSKEKKKREKKRRRNTRLDQRIAREKNLSSDEKRELDKGIARRIAINVLLVLMWYLLSLAISLVRFLPSPCQFSPLSQIAEANYQQYNKWMFDKNRLNFAFPLFTTSMHMIVQFALSALVLYFIPSLRPPSAQNSDMRTLGQESESTNKPVMDKWFYLTRIGPCGAATGLDIGLGNTSLKFISLTFYSMSSINAKG